MRDSCHHENAGESLLKYHARVLGVGNQYFMILALTAFLVDYYFVSKMVQIDLFILLCNWLCASLPLTMMHFGSIR